MRFSPFSARPITAGRLLWSLVLACVTCLSSADIHYFVRVDPTNKSFVVGMQVVANADSTIFRIPAWSPGYYHIETFQDRISAVAAKDDAGNTLSVTKVDDRGWSVATKNGESVHFSYRVAGNDSGLGFFGPMVGNRNAFINGASTFMYVDGRKTEADKLTVENAPGWDLVTPMEKVGDQQFQASSGYDEFIDMPIQFGFFRREKFTVEGLPFEAIFVTSGPKLACDPKVEVERLRRVSAPAIQMFGEAGFKHYTYILHLDPSNFQGGLEHRASTCIDVPNDAHLNLDDLAAHENFHSWNVKQIRPFVLGPFDYTGPCRTGNLWWMEGVTDYYAKILTYRSGLDDSSWLTGQFTDQVSELQNSQVRKRLTLEDASRGCWESDGFGVGDFSFYTKGLLVGLLLDAEIRSASKGEKSLDDVIRLLFTKYRLPQPGLQEDGIERAIDEVLGSNELDAIYDKMLRSTDDLPYGELRKLGLQLELPGKPYTTASYTASKGVVVHVSGPAQDAGLRPGDKLISISPVEIGPDGQLSATQTMVVERAGQNLSLTVPIITLMGDHLEVMFDPAAGSDALRIRAAWLARKP